MADKVADKAQALSEQETARKIAQSFFLQMQALRLSFPAQVVGAATLLEALFSTASPPERVMGQLAKMFKDIRENVGGAIDERLAEAKKKRGSGQ